MKANYYTQNSKNKGKFYRVVNIIVMTAFLFNMTATQGLLMLSPATANAANTAWEHPAHNGIPNEWSDGEKAYTSNNQWATANDDDDDQGYRQFTLGVPDDAAINGIEIHLEAAQEHSGDTCQLQARLSWNNGINHTERKTITPSGPSDGNYYLGGAADTWGRAWTADELSNSNFKVEIRRNDSSDGCDSSGDTKDDLKVDLLEARAYYTEVPHLLITNATVNGGATTTVLQGASVNLKTFVTTNGSGSDNDWRSTAYRIEGGDWQCVNTADHTHEGSFSENFNITAPGADGTYDVEVKVFNNDSCDGSVFSAVYTLQNAIVIETPTINIVAHKIVCSDEADLPNLHTVDTELIAPIDENTAEEWVESHDSCELVPDWKFQYRVNNGTPYNPGDNFIGEASGDWKTFGPTDANGMTSKTLNYGLTDQYWLREVPKEGYIPFTYEVSGNTDHYTAEFYCNTDVVNYDNLDWINGMEPGETYNCVAWNVLDEEPTYNLHGYKWNDLNGNQDPDCTPVKGSEITTVATPPLDCEPRLPNWGITLNGGDPIYTDANGEYEFTDLPAGNYTICEVQQDGWYETTPYHNNGCHFVTLPGGEQSSYNFGNIHDKGNLTINKLDHNGQPMNDVEFKIDGVTSDAYKTVNGTFTVEGLLTGYHVVEEMGVDNYTFTSVEGVNCTDSNPSAANVIKTGTTCTFTNTRNTGELSGIKYDDVNGNGDRDCEIPNKSMTLINGPVDDPECEPVLPGWTINIERNLCSTNTADYNLIGEEVVLDLSDVSVMATYLSDGNLLGDFNDDEVTNQADFTCFSAMFSGNPLPASYVDSAETDAEGYQFTNLLPGSYNVCEIPKLEQQGWQQTEPGDYTNPNNSECYTLLVSSGDEIYDVDFGNTYVGYCGDEIVNNGEECDYYSNDENFYCTKTCHLQENMHYTVSGYKFEDLDGDKTWDKLFEQPLNDWQICSAYVPDTIDKTEVTAFSLDSFARDIMEVDPCVITGSGEEWEDGYYEFKFYNPGHTTITEIQKPGYIQTKPDGGNYEIALEGENLNLINYDFGNQPNFSVSIAKTANKTVVGPLEQINYSVNWKLDGIITANTAVIIDTLPAKVTFVSATDLGSYNPLNHTITWTQTNVEPGKTGSYGVTVQTTAGVTNTEELINNVKILATKDINDSAEAAALAFAPGVISIERSATASAKVTVSVTPAVTNPLLQITKDVNVATADAGDTVTYTVVVTNVGSATATNVMVDDTLPAGMTFVDGGGTTVTLVLGDIAIGQSKTTTYDVKVADTATTGTYENLATAYANNHGKVTDTAIVDVESPIVLGDTTEAELALIKTADVEFTNPGGMVEYTLTITNNGTEDAQNVVLTDQLPEGFLFEGTTDAVKVWEFATIAVGSAETVTYKVSVDAAAVTGMYDNVALATADNSENAGASATVEVRAVSVLGELVETGTTLRDYILYFAGIMLVVSGIWFFTRERKLPQTK